MLVFFIGLSAVLSVLYIAERTEKADDLTQESGIPTQAPVTVEDNSVTPPEQEMLSFSEYKTLFSNFVAEFEIEELPYMDFSQVFHIVTSIENTFGEREWITLDGTRESEPTINVAVFENEEHTIHCTVQFMYTDFYLGKNMYGGGDLHIIGVDESKKFTQTIYNYTYGYKNIIINYTMRATEPELFYLEDESHLPINTGLELVRFLSDY